MFNAIGMKKFLLLFSLLIILFPTIVIAQDKLIFAVDIIRHGDRTPTKDFPKDPYAWPQGLGQLTPLGMQEEYQLGLSFRKLYVDQYHLLPVHFEINTMLVFSDRANRTIQSALSLLYGLYPLGTGPKIANQFALPEGFQPIPVFTTMNFGEWSIATSERKTYHNLLQQQVFASKQWQIQQQQWKGRFAQLSKITGFKIDNLHQLITVGQNLFIRKIHHVAFPKGISTDEASQLILLSKHLEAEPFAPHAIGNLLSSQLINQIKNYLTAATNKKSPLKYVLFSAHDTTILAFMSAFKMPLEQQPHYASDVKILLFENSQNQEYVKMIYNDKLLKLPYCHNKTQCPLSQFFP